MELEAGLGRRAARPVALPFSLDTPSPPRLPVLAAICLALAACAAGCSTVVTLQPLTSAAPPPEVARLEGTWQAEDGVIQVRVTGPATASLGILEWRRGEFTVDLGEATMSRSGERTFISLRYREDGRWMEGRFFAQYALTPAGFLVIWTPRPEAFADAAAAGVLPAEVRDDDSGKTVTLTGPPERILEFIGDPKRLDLFDYQDPIVLRHAGGGGDRATPAPGSAPSPP